MAKKKKKVVKKKANNSKKKKTNTKKKNTSVKSNVASKSSTVKKSASSTKKSASVNNKVNVKKSSTGSNKVNIKKKEEVKVEKEKISINIKAIVIVFVVLVVCVCGFLFISSNMNNNKNSVKLNEISFDEYLDLYKKEELSFIYLYHPSCINCNSYEEKLLKLESEFDIKINKLDYSNFDESDLSILKSSNSFLEDGISIPIILSIKNGYAVGGISGIKEYSALKNFVNLSKEEVVSNSFNKINVDSYLSILSSKDKSVIFICDSSQACNKFSGVLESVSKSRKLKINFLNTDNITDSNDWEKLESSNKIFKDVWFMPVIMVVKDNKVISYKMETMSEEDLNSFFKKNKM